MKNKLLMLMLLAFTSSADAAIPTYYRCPNVDELNKAIINPPDCNSRQTPPDAARSQEDEPDGACRWHIKSIIKDQVVFKGEYNEDIDAVVDQNLIVLKFGVITLLLPSYLHPVSRIACSYQSNQPGEAVSMTSDNAHDFANCTVDKDPTMMQCPGN